MIHGFVPEDGDKIAQNLFVSPGHQPSRLKSYISRNLTGLLENGITVATNMPPKKTSISSVAQPNPNTNRKIDQHAQKNNTQSQTSNMEVDLTDVLEHDPDKIPYLGPPENAEVEGTAVANKLYHIGADSMGRPHINIEEFSIFHQNGYLYSLENGLSKDNSKIYMSGYLGPNKIITPECDVRMPVRDIGPLVEWVLDGTGGKDKYNIVVYTSTAAFILQDPTEQYQLFIDLLFEKIRISKVVVEFLLKFRYMHPVYEDLISHIEQYCIPELGNKNITEDLLLQHAKFVCEQVSTLDGDDKDNLLMKLPCIEKLMEIMGINIQDETLNKIGFKKVNKKAWTKATTTPLVRKTFEIFFTSQLDKADENASQRKKCGICQICQMADCGECRACRAMLKFGGKGLSTKTCERRVCPNVDKEQLEDEDDDNDESNNMINLIPVKVTTSYRKIRWVGQPIQVDEKAVYYEKVELDDRELRNGDFVMVETVASNIPPVVAKIIYMWKNMRTKEECFHAEVFMRSSYTILGEVGYPREIFLIDHCIHEAPIASILRRAYVEKKEIPADWRDLGGKEEMDVPLEDNGKIYFYSKYYNRFTCRFEDLPEDLPCPNIHRKHRFCPSCERKTKREMKCIPRIYNQLTNEPLGKRSEFGKVLWRGNEYKKGCGVFLDHRTFKLRNRLRNPEQKPRRGKLKKVDENIYPEYFRKNTKNLRGSNMGTDRPFCVGYIERITALRQGYFIAPHQIFLTVRVMYRPENTKIKLPHREDLNVVYWTERIVDVPFGFVTGPCHLIYERNIPQDSSLDEWLEKDPNRFYFARAYDRSKGCLKNVPKQATTVGATETTEMIINKGHAKGTSNRIQIVVAPTTQEQDVRPMRMLDVFAGCGGLSEGLHRAGVAECNWAVENDEAAAYAYSLNYKRCSVFVEDGNAFLHNVLSGETHSNGLRMPVRGEVELLCGGPPCQGFSGMNRFNSCDYSNFKNSLIATFLSFCDYYRPNYFILENVRNFVAFKRGMVLKLTIRALLDMGYQCTFGVLQAGHFGVPQTRRRVFLIAAAPGQVLPLFPEPTHVFNRQGCFLSVNVDGKRFNTGTRWKISAPRRTCTVRDAMSDLPEIFSGASEIEIDYNSIPETQFQRNARWQLYDAKLRDHICKKMSPLVQARIGLIPTTLGADWRDLPNISVELSDGTKTNVLEYRYDDKKNGRSRTGAMRGVCACATGLPCTKERQHNTLIPWCLPHTANRHNNWAGLYGRVTWEGYFSTTVTDPEPMGKQGRVLHPSQPRVVSVRECARSQAFPDHFKFAGNLMDKHRQIGNAVPPPLAAALGREIKKAMKAEKSLFI